MKAFSRSHLVLVAIAAAAILAFFDLQWLDTLRYRVAFPDFFVYYLAAQLGQAHGWAAMYDPSLFLPAVTSAVGRPLPYLNPPELAWLVLPLSWLTYALAALIWSGILAGAFAVAWHLVAPGTRAWKVVHGLAAAMLLPVFVSFMIGQTSLIIVAAVAVAWWLMRRDRPWLAGIALAVVFLKPQAAFLVPVALLLAGYWRVFVGWLGVSALLTAIGLLVVGTSVFHNVMQSLADVQDIPGPVQISLGRQLPLPAALIGILLVLAVSAWVVRRARPGDSSIPIAVGLVASMLISPYINFYDLSAPVLAGWLILRTNPPRWQHAITFMVYIPIYVAPIFPLITLAALCGWLVSLAALPVRQVRPASTISPVAA